MTAKSTLFGQRTFSSWRIEVVGSVPVKRRMDGSYGDNDNTLATNSPIQAASQLMVDPNVRGFCLLLGISIMTFLYAY